MNELTDQQRRYGMRLCYVGQANGAVLFYVLHQSAIGVLLVKHLGGSDLQAMLLGAVPMLARVCQLPASLLVAPWHGKRFMLRCWLGAAAIWAVAIAIIWLPPGAIRMGLFLTTLTAAAMLLMIGTTFWFPLLHDLVPDDQRGRFFGRMRTAWNLASFLAIVLAGLFLGPSPSTWQFQAIIAVFLLMNVSRNWFIKRVPECPAVRSPQGYSDWRAYVRHLLRRRDIKIFCSYYALFSFFAGFMAVPLVLYLQRMGFAVRDNVLTFGFATLGQVIFLMVGGELADRIGTKTVFVGAHIALCLLALAVIAIGWQPLETARILMPIALVLAGGMGAMAGVAGSSQLFHLAPDRGLAFFMSLSMILVSVGNGLAPLVMGWLLQATPLNWSWAIGGWELNIFQAALAVSAGLMLLLLVMLIPVHNYRRQTSPVAA